MVIIGPQTATINIMEIAQARASLPQLSAETLRFALAVVLAQANMVVMGCKWGSIWSRIQPPGKSLQTRFRRQSLQGPGGRVARGDKEGCATLDFWNCLFNSKFNNKIRIFLSCVVCMVGSLSTSQQPVRKSFLTVLKYI